MSAISQTQRILLNQRPLFLILRRHNTRESIHKHVEPNKFKKHMLSACEPYMRPEYKLPNEICVKPTTKAQELHPLDIIYANELVEDINNSNFVLFIQYNYTKFQSERVYKNTLTKLGGKFQFRNNRVYSEAFRILKQEHLRTLCVTKNALLTGQAENLPACVIALRKMPQFILLAGTIDGNLYNFDQLRTISVSNDIDQCRANLLNVLETPGINLSSDLEEYSKMNKD